MDMTYSASELPWVGIAPSAGNEVKGNNLQRTHFFKDSNFYYDIKEPKVRVYRQTLNDYRREREECEQEFFEEQPIDDDDDMANRECYPEQVLHEIGDGGEIEPISDCIGILMAGKFDEMRYGRYCGKGHPNDGAFSYLFREPLDGVDYCCRLHDDEIWGDPELGQAGINQCGIAMCLSQASGWPASITQTMSDTENARQCWYEWATMGCLGNQPDDAPFFLGLMRSNDIPLREIQVTATPINVCIDCE